MVPNLGMMLGNAQSIFVLARGLVKELFLTSRRSSFEKGLLPNSAQAAAQLSQFTNLFGNSNEEYIEVVARYGK